MKKEPAKAIMTLRNVDPNTRQRFKILCATVGITMQDALNLLMRHTNEKTLQDARKLEESNN